MIAVNCWRLNATLIPSTAVTAASPFPYTLTAAMAWATTSGAATGAGGTGGAVCGEGSVSVISVKAKSSLGGGSASALP